MTIPVPPPAESSGTPDKYIPDVSALDGTVIPPVQDGLAAFVAVEARPTASAKRTAGNASKRYDTSVLGGTGLSSLNARNERNVRAALNQQLLGAGAWFDASATICGAMLGNPFMAGAIQRGIPTSNDDPIDPDSVGFNLFYLLDGIQDFINWVINTLTCGVFDSDGDGTPDLIQTILQDFIDFILENPLVAPFITGFQMFADWLGRATGNLIKDVMIGIAALFDWIKGILCCEEDVVGTTPMMLIDAVQGFIDAVLANPLVAAFVSWASSVNSAVGNLFYDLLEGAGELFLLGCSLLTTGHPPDGFQWTATDNPISEVVGSILGIFEALCAFPLFAGFTDLVEGTGRVVLDAINGAIAFVTQVLDFLGLDEILNPVNIINWITDVINFVWNGLSWLTGGLTDQIGKTLQDVVTLAISVIAKIPLIGPLLLKITGINIDDLVGDPLTAALNAIGDFFNPASQLINNFINLAKDSITQAITGGLVSLETFFAGITSGSLIQEIQRFFSLENIANLVRQAIGLFLPTIPIGAVGDKEVNLLQLGEFKTIGSIEGSNGWSFDSSKNKSGVTGGSAKINCATTSGTRQLYSNQNIQVVAGDKIGVSAFVNTSGFNGSSSSIQIGIVTFAGSVQKATYLLASRGASNNVWGELTNRSSLWTVPTAANPADQITSVQVTLAVAASATQGSVNWDDLSLWKGGLMQQGLVEYLINSWNNLIGGLSTNSTGGTPPAANTTAPWDSLLGAGAAARQQANSALANAAAADGKAVGAQGTADGANNRLTNTNQGLFGQDSFTTGTKLDEGVFPPTVGAVGSGIIMKREALSPYAVGIRGGYDFSYVTRNFFTSTPIDTGDLEYELSNPYAAFKAKNAGWYLIELGFALNFTKQYTYWWSFTPVVYETRTAIAKYGTTVVSARDTNAFASFTMSPGFAQSSFICYMNPGDRVYAAYNARKENTTSGTDELVGVSSGGMTYFSAALLNRSLA